MHCGLKGPAGGRERHPGGLARTRHLELSAGGGGLAPPSPRPPPPEPHPRPPRPTLAAGFSSGLVAWESMADEKQGHRESALVHKPRGRDRSSWRLDTEEQSHRLTVRREPEIAGQPAGGAWNRGCHPRPRPGPATSAIPRNHSATLISHNGGAVALVVERRAPRRRASGRKEALTDLSVALPRRPVDVRRG